MKQILFFLLFASPLYLLAQQKLNGTITDPEGKLLDAATLSLMHDGKIISTQIANQGNYSLDVDKQFIYQLNVSIVGYKSRKIDIKAPFTTMNIVLTSESTQLKEVTLTYKKPTIERKTDRVIFNVENSPIAAGGTLLEAIAKAPGVRVSSTGNISASNKGATVYIDDRPVRLGGEDLTAYLQSIPADQVTKIEIMSNPSARYEAQGGAVVNIVSKKMKDDGFNTNLNGGYTQGRLASGRTGALFNYNKGKLNIIGNYSYNNRNQRRAIENDILYQSPGSDSFWDINKKLLPISRTHNYTLGLDFNLTPHQVFGIFVTGNSSSNANNSFALTSITNQQKTVPDSVLHTDNNNTGNTAQYSFNLNYKINFNTHSAILNADIDYVPFRNSSIQSVDNTSNNSAGIFTSAPYRSLSPSMQNIDIWSGKVDYEMKLTPGFGLESGLKYNSIVTGNKFDYFDIIGAQQDFDPSKSDFFKYSEQTAAAYGTLSGKFGKLEIKAGVRAEQTYTKGISYTADSTNKNSYLRFFPSAFLSYRFSDQHVLGMNFARRIERPGYSQLNPAKIYISPYAYSSGNPFLLPAISTNLEVNYIYKEHYTLTATYFSISDLTNQLTVQDNVNHTFFTTQVNTGKIQDLGLQLMATNNPTDWWEINSYLEGYARRQDLRYQTGKIENSFHYYIRADNTFSISKKNGLRAELTAWYVGPLQQGTYHLKSTWDVSTGVSKTLWNNRATLRLAVNDLFLSNPIKIRIDYLNQHTGFLYNNDSRNATLSFTYKIGKKIKEARNRKTAAEEEKQRNH
jgi:outer membrane receptor protein involved in Fe transport